MTGDVLQRLESLERRLENTVLVGTVSDTDYDNARVKIESGELKTGWLPWIAERAGSDRTWWAPEPGEQVVVLSPGGQVELGVVLPALYRDTFPAPGASPDVCRVTYADGADISYDRASHTLTATLPDGGTMNVTSPGGITVAAEGGVRVTGDMSLNGSLSVTGDVKADGDVADSHASMAADRTIYNSHTHTGNAGAPTSPPAQTQ